MSELCENCVNTPPETAECTELLYTLKPGFGFNPTVHGWIIDDKFIDYGVSSFETAAGLEYFLNKSNTVGDKFTVKTSELGEWEVYICGDPAPYGALLGFDSCWADLGVINSFPLPYSTVTDGVVYQDELFNFPPGTQFDTADDLLAWLSDNFAGSWTVLRRGSGYIVGGFVECGEECEYDGFIIQNGEWDCVIRCLEFPLTYEQGDGIIFEGQLVEFPEAPGTFNNVDLLVEALNNMDLNGTVFEGFPDTDGFRVCTENLGGEIKGLKLSPRLECCCILEDEFFPWFPGAGAAGVLTPDGGFSYVPSVGFGSPLEAAEWFTAELDIDFYAIQNADKDWSICCFVDNCEDIILYNEDPRQECCALEGVTFPDFSSNGIKGVINTVGDFVPIPNFYTPGQAVEFFTQNFDLNFEAIGQLDGTFNICARVQTFDECFNIQFEDLEKRYVSGPWVFPMKIDPCRDGVTCGDRFIPFSPETTVFDSPNALADAMTQIDPLGRTFIAELIEEDLNGYDCKYRICYFARAVEPGCQITLQSEYICIVGNQQYKKTYTAGQGWTVNTGNGTTCTFEYPIEQGEENAWCTGKDHANWFTENDLNGCEFIAEHLGGGEYNICSWINADLVFMYVGGSHQAD